MASKYSITMIGTGITLEMVHLFVVEAQEILLAFSHHDCLQTEIKTEV